MHAAPSISFVAPTPEDGTGISGTSVDVNTTITGASLGGAFMDWNDLLTGYWAFEESGGNDVYDNSTHGNTGKIFNGLRNSSGRFGSAVSLDGTDDYVEVPTSGELNFNGATGFTAEMWVKVDSYTGSYSTLMSKGTSDTPDFMRWSLGTVNGDFHIRLNGNGGVDSVDITKKMTAGSWHHVAFVFNGSESKIYSYLDGVLISTDHSANTRLRDSNTIPLRFGTQSDGHDWLDGTVDEARVWKRALSAQEINASYNNSQYRLENNFDNLAEGGYEFYAFAINTSGGQTKTGTREIILDTTLPGVSFVPPTPEDGITTGNRSVYINVTVDDDNPGGAFIDWNNLLSGYWAFEESSGRAFDNSTWGNDGRLFGGATRTISGKFGRGIILDGSSGYAEVPTSHSLNFDGATGFTAEMWVKVDKYTGSYSTLMSKGTSDTPDFMRWSLGSDDGDFHIRLKGDGGIDTIDITEPVPEDTWHHVAFVFNGSEQKIYSYLDGNLISTNDSANTMVRDPDLDPFRFGTQSDGGDWLNGMIDEVKVWKRALSAQEINASYNNGLYRLENNFNGLDNGVYSYYAFATDAAGNQDKSDTQDVNVSEFYVETCGTITGSGTYTVENDLTGTQDYQSCLYIFSSDLVLDCNNHYITGNGSGKGITLSKSTNVTLQNCQLGNYSNGISLLSSNYTVIQNSTVSNSTYGIYMDPSYNNTIIENTLYNNSLYGLYMEDSHNNTVRNNTAYNNSKGFFLNISTNNTLRDNIAYNNSEGGIVLLGSLNNTLRNNTARNNTGYGIYLSSASDENIIENNTAYGNINHGFIISSGSGNNLTDNTAYDNAGAGFLLDLSTDNRLSNNSAYNNTWEGFELMTSSNSNILINNTAYNNTLSGFLLSSSDFNNLTDNYAYNNTLHGIYIYSGSSNNLTDNGAYNNTQNGILLELGVIGWCQYNILDFNDAQENGEDGYSTATCSYNNFTNNRGHGNIQEGFHISTGSNNLFLNNSAYLNQVDGFYIGTSTDNTLTNNTVHDNGGTGIYVIADSNYINLTGNTVYGNQNGILLEANILYSSITNSTVYDNSNWGIAVRKESYDNTLFNNTAFGNGYGLIISNSINVSANYTTLYSNGHDFYAECGSSHPTGFRISDMIITNPSGTLENYTNLSIDDALDDASGEQYFINWTTNSSSLPSNRISFAQEFVNITKVAGPATVSIHSITWHWTDAESATYNESRFELWRYNASGWAMLNDTPDSNTLGLTDMSPASDYAILQNNASENCPVITASGTFTMAENYAGSPNDASDIVSGATACVRINASDVDFDCNGHHITNDGTPDSTYGIVANNVTNITVRNCAGISNYTAGIFLARSNHDVINNNTVYNNSGGIVLIGVFNSNVTNNFALNSSDGLLVNMGINDTLDNNAAHNNEQGIVVRNSTLTTVTNNVAYNNTNFGFYLNTNASNNTLFNNTASSQPDTGFYVWNSSNNNLTQNFAYGNNEGFVCLSDDYAATNNLFENNTAHNNSNGFHMENSSGNTVTNNQAYNNSNVGITAIESDNNTIGGNLAYFNTALGIYIHSARGNNLTNNTAYNNTAAGIELYVANDSTVSGNHIYDNEQNGIYLEFGTGNSITGNNISGSVDGLRLDTVNNVAVTGNNFTNNRNISIYLRSVLNGNISGNLFTSEANPIFGEASDTTGLVVCDNTMTGCTYDGIQYEASNGLFCNNNISSSGADSAAIHFSGAAMASNNTVIGNRVWNNSHGIWLEPANNTLVEGNTVYNNTHGITIQDGSGQQSRNNTLSGNDVYSNGDGIVISTGDNTLFNNTAYNNTLYGIGIFSAMPTNATDNIAHDNPLEGFFLGGGTSNNILFNNSAYGNLRGFRIDDASNFNTFTNNSAYSNTEHGFYMASGSGNGFINNTAHDNIQVGFYMRGGSANNTFENNTAYNCSAGFDAELDNNDRFIGNTARNNSNYGFQLWGGSGNSFSSNTAHGNSDGFHMESSSNDNNLTGNSAYNNTAYGFYLSNSSRNLFDHNNASGNQLADFGLWIESNYNNITNNNMSGHFGSNYGVYMLSGQFNLFDNNYASSHSQADIYARDSNNTFSNNYVTDSNRGFWLEVSRNGSFTNNTAEGNAGYGFYIDSSNTNFLSGNIMAGNNVGVHVSRSDATYLSGDHFYDNALDFDASAIFAVQLNLSDVIFDSPTGNFQNFTNLTLDDALAGGEEYTINWNAEPAALPGNLTSVNGTYANITTVSGSVSLDTVQWRYYDSQIGGLNESRFEIWKYNASGWANAHATLDTGANTLTLTGLVPGSTYSLLEDNNITTNCPIIAASGEYAMAQNYTGSPNAVGGDTACVSIDASDVVFDCAGYSITNDGTGGTTSGVTLGVFRHNITIENCNVSGYTLGIDLGATLNDTVLNSTAHNNTYGFRIVNVGQAGNNTLIGNTAYNNTQSFALYGASNNTLLDDTAYDSGVGFFSIAGDNNTYGNCTSYNNSFAYLIQQSRNNTFANGTIHDNTYGLYIDTNSNGNYIANNTGYGHATSAAFILHSCSGNTFINNTAHDNNYGFGGGGDNMTDNAFTNNTAYGNTYGFVLSGYNRTTFANNSAYGNANALTIDGSNNSAVTGNDLHDNSGLGIFVEAQATNNNLTNNIIHGNGNGGTSISESHGTLISGDHYYGNSRDFEIASFGTSASANLSGVIFDNPSGDYQNYTNISLDDALGWGESYYIDWSSQPSDSLNFGLSSVNGTFVTIEQTSGMPVTIDRMAWHWDDSLIGGHNESKFELWKDNQNYRWNNTDATLNTVANTLTITNMNPQSTYSIQEAADCRDEDGDGAPWSYVPGICGMVQEDCNDDNRYLVPPFAGLSLLDYGRTYVLCPGTYHIDPPPMGDSNLIHLSNYNVTLDCNGVEIINDNGQATVVNGYNGYMGVRNCVITGAREGISLGSSFGPQVYGNVLTNCTTALVVSNMQNASIHDNTILGSIQGMTLRNDANSSVYDNVLNSTLLSYYASSQYLNYSGTIFDNVAPGSPTPQTLFVPNDVFATGGQPCVVSADNDSLAACSYWLNGTTDLSVALNDLSPLDFGGNATIVINDDFTSCDDVNAWWDANHIPHPPCYFACKLYTANGAGNEYTLNESCFNETVNVSGDLTYPPYIRYGASATYGLSLTHSQANLLYNNLFATTNNVQDSNDGYFQDYFGSLSPITYNGLDYNGTPSGIHTYFIYTSGGGSGNMGANDYVGSDNTLLSPDYINPSHSFGVFVANFTRNTGTNYVLQTVYFDSSNLNWHNCTNVESDLNNFMSPGDCHAFCQNILTSNGPGHNYTLDPSCLNATFNITSSYTYPPYIHYLNYSVMKNKWNTTKQNGPSIIGGAKIGGNFYSDYTGIDTDGDGIGNSPNYYNITNSGGAVVTTDRLPLTNNNGTSAGCVNLSDDSTFNANITDVDGVFHITGSVSLCRDNYTTNGTMFVIDNSNLMLDCNGSSLMGDLGNGENGINATTKENLGITNCTIANFSSAIYFLDVNRSSISDCDVYGNSGLPSGEINAALALLFSHGNNITNNSVHNNNFFGLLLGSSTGNTIANNSIVNNSVVSIFVVPFVIDSCNNSILDNTGGYYGKPIAYEHDTSGITVENSDNFSEILWCNVSNSAMRNVEVSNGPGRKDGLLLVLSQGNLLDNISSHNNFVGVYFAFGSVDNVLSNSSMSNNTQVGLVIDNGRNNTVVSNSIFSNSQTGLELSSDSDNNTFTNNTLYGNNVYGGGNYDIRISGNQYDGYPEYNIFNNTLIYGTINPLGFSDQSFTNASNFTNLTICYNASLGCISWDFLNLTYANLGNGSNIILNPYFVSLNTSDAGAIQLNGSANITITSSPASCALQYIRAAGFPQSKAAILAAGSEVIPAYASCTDGIATFSTVGAFSGYALNATVDCRDNDGDGANYSYVLGACAGQVEDCDDTDQYVLPPRSGLYLNDQNQVYTFCPGTYSIASPSGDSAIRINNNNITLDCNGAIISSDRNQPVIAGYNGLMTVKNCNVVNGAYGIYFGWASQGQIYNNNLTNCTYGMYVENGQQDTAIYNNRIYGALYGMQLKNSANTSVHDNTVNSSILGYFASNQYLNYSGTIFNSGGGGPPGTLFVPSDILGTGGSPCTVSQDGDSLSVCPAFNGTQDLSVFLNDLSMMGAGNATLIINDNFNSCDDVDAWWEAALGPGNAPPCYFACRLYTANGVGNDYTLNELCYNATVNVSGSLTYPPYIRHGLATTYGIQLTHSSDNSIYNNVFATTINTQDSNNGYFQDYVASYSPVTYNGQDYNGSNYPYQGDHTLFLRDVNNGYLGSSDWVSSDDTVMRPDNIDGTQSYGMFVGNFSGQLMTIYFDRSNLNWHNCADVENDLHSMLTPGGCHAFCQSILTSNGAGHNYTFDPSCLTANFNITSGKTYPPYIHYSNYSAIKNSWNTTKHLGPNIIGGLDIGGNSYSDYYGADTDGDGIGNIPDHYDILMPDGSVATTDRLPLTNNVSAVCVDLTDPATFAGKISGDTGTGFTVIQNTTLCSGSYNVNATGGVALSILTPDIALDCAGATITGKGTGYGATLSGANRSVLDNCVLRNYSWGVYVGSHSDNSTLSGLNVGNGSIGVYVQDSDGVQLTNLVVSDVYDYGPEQSQGIKLQESMYTNISNVNVSNIGSMGQGFCIATDDNSGHTSIYDSVASGCGMDGLDLHASDFYIENITVTGSVLGAFIATSPSSGTMVDSTLAENYYADLIALTCDWDISNIMGSGNRPVIFLNDANSSGSFTGAHVSELLLCNAANMDVSNINIEGSSNFNNNGLILTGGASGNTIGGVTSSDNFAGVLLLNAGNNNNVSGGTFANDLYGIQYGFDIEDPVPGSAPGTTNTVENTAISGAIMGGIGAVSNTSNIITRNITISGSASPIYLKNATGMNFSGITISSPTGFALNISDASQGNAFDNVIIYGADSYIYQQPLASGSNSLHNLSIAGSLSGSRVYLDDAAFDDLSLTRSSFAFDHDFVSVDSAAASLFGTSGHVQLDIGSCSDFDASKIIYADGFHASRASIIAAGLVCPASICSNVVCNGGLLSFNVAHFSGYAYGANANLVISNDGPKLTNETITFTANYSNSSDSSHIMGASCNLTLFNGSTYAMNENVNIYDLQLNVTQAGVHTYNVTCANASFSTLSASDTFTISTILNASNVTLTLVNITNSTSLTRWEGPNVSSPANTEGGNVSDLNLTSSSLTDRWAAFYGNISNDIYLTDNEGSSSLYVYHWDWTAEEGGAVCASTNNTFSSFSAGGASGSDIDVAWGFGNVSDSGANTFTNPDCNITITGASIANAFYADTGDAGGFETCALKTVQVPAKSEMLFCSVINSTGVAYNTEPANFEIIVPTAFGPGVYETYYMYMSMD